MRLVERKITPHEFRNERFEPYQEPCFWDGLDHAFLVAKEIDHIVVLDITGALAGPDSHEFSVRIQRLVERGERIIMVNVGAITKVDAEGVGELVRSVTTLKRVGGMMPLVNAPQQFRRLVASMKFL